jgi:hypothetical protein
MIIRIAAAGAALVCASIGLAGPANAEALDGSYTAVLSSSSGPATLTQTWDFVPCGPDCARRIADGLELHLQGNTWTGSTIVNGGTCTTSIDATTLAGVTAACGVISFPVQLTKVG